MMGSREALLAMVIVAAAIGAVPAAGAVDYCNLPWGVASSAPLQDDAGSGLDAGDSPADAVTLPGHATYVAFLDPIRRDGGDLEDWYVVHVAPGADVLRFSVTRDYENAAAYSLEVDFRIEVFAPGADAPSHVSSSRGGEIRLDDWQPGTWSLRISVLDPADPLYQCGAGAPLVRGTGVGGTTSEAVRNYIVYFGCEPHCAAAA